MIKITEKLESKTQFKTEIDSGEIGKVLSPKELPNYEPKHFKVIFFTPSRLPHAQGYLRNENKPFLYVGSDQIGTVLVPNAVVSELKQRYEGTNVPFHTVR